MSKTVVGMLIGALIAFTWVSVGFWAMLFVVLASVIGAGVGRILEGKLDVRELVDIIRGRKSS